MIGFRTSHAVVIGIDKYRHGIPTLRTAVNDARKVAQALETNFGYVVHLMDADVTLERLRVRFGETLPREVEAEDRLLVYFAGHGIALNGDDGPAGYLVPQDARREDRGTFLPMTELSGWLERLSCRHLLLVLDCCFAGAFRWSSTRDLGAPPEVIYRERFDRYISDPAWQVITSAAYDQKALDVLSGEAIDLRGRDSDNAGHSPFAAAFLRGLKGEADVVRRVGTDPPVGDGVITATELYLYLRDCVEVGAEGDGHRQTPGLWPLKRHDKGEFIHLVPGHELILPPAPELDEANNPYRGLHSYDEEEAPLFFGRAKFVAALAGRVRNQSLTIVLGASGTGKSSVVKAGLLPWLRSSEPEAWQILPPIRPGKSPMAILAGLTLPGESGEPDAIDGRLAASRSDSEALACRVADWAASTSAGMSPPARLVIVVDQFEELLTLCWDAAERERFLVQLDRVLAACPDRMRIVLTLRSDFEPQFAHSPLQEEWLSARIVVPAMTLDEYREAIEGPASVKVLYFQGKESSQGFIDRLIGDVANTPGALPLLSFTLSELYRCHLERGGGDRALDEVDYERLGGVGGSLRNRADEVFRDLPDDAHRETMRRMMLRMVSVEGGEIARRRVPDDELRYESDAENGRVQVVRGKLTDARLVVLDKDVDGRPFVEPAHDALLWGWDKILNWSRLENEGLQLRRRLTPAALAWERNSGSTWAFGEPRLGLLNSIRTSPDSWLNKSESRFIRFSRQLRTAVLLGFIAATLAVIAVVSFLGWQTYQQLEATRRSLADGYIRAIGDSDGSIGEVERTTLGDLAREPDERVRYLFFERVLASPRTARQLRNRIDMAVHFVVRFDPTLRQQVHALIARRLGQETNSRSSDSLDIKIACSQIGCLLDSVELEPGGRFAHQAVETFLEAASKRTGDLALYPRYLVALQPYLTPAQSERAARRILDVIPLLVEYREQQLGSDLMYSNTEKVMLLLPGYNNSGLVSPYLDTLALFGRHLSSPEAEQNVRVVLGWYKKGLFPEEADAWARCFAVLADKLSPAAADQVAAKLPENAIMPDGNVEYLLSLSQSLTSLAGKLSDDRVQQVNKRLMEVLLGTLPKIDPSQVPLWNKAFLVLSHKLGVEAIHELLTTKLLDALSLAVSMGLGTRMFDALAEIIPGLVEKMLSADAEQLANRFLEDPLRNTPDLPKWMNAFKALASRLDSPSRVRLLRKIPELIRTRPNEKTVVSIDVPFLARAFAILAEKRTEAAVREIANRLAEMVEELLPVMERSQNILDMAESLAALGDRIEDERAHRVAAIIAKRLIDTISASDTVYDLRSEAEALAAVSNKLEGMRAREIADQLARKLLKLASAITNSYTTNYNDLETLAQSLAILKDNLDKDRTREVADVLAWKALMLNSETFHWSEFPKLMRARAALADMLPEARARGITDRFAERIQSLASSKGYGKKDPDLLDNKDQPIEPIGLECLTLEFTKLTNGLDDENARRDADRLAGEIIRRIQDLPRSSSGDSEVLARALVALTDWLSSARVVNGAERTLRWLVETTPAIDDTDEFKKRSSVIGLLVDRLDAPAAGRLAQEVLDVLAVCPAASQREALARMFDAILTKARLDDVLAVYRHYLCRARLEGSILRVLGAHLGRLAPLEDRWELMIWLEAHRASSPVAGKAYEELQGPLIGPIPKTNTGPH